LLLPVTLLHPTNLTQVTSASSDFDDFVSILLAFVKAKLISPRAVVDFGAGRVGNLVEEKLANLRQVSTTIHNVATVLDKDFGGKLPLDSVLQLEPLKLAPTVVSLLSTHIYGTPDERC
jgi:hypothetical protein